MNNLYQSSPQGELLLADDNPNPFSVWQQPSTNPDATEKNNVANVGASSLSSIKCSSSTSVSQISQASLSSSPSCSTFQHPSHMLNHRNSQKDLELSNSPIPHSLVLAASSSMYRESHSHMPLNATDSVSLLFQDLVSTMKESQEREAVWKAQRMELQVCLEFLVASSTAYLNRHLCAPGENANAHTQAYKNNILSSSNVSSSCSCSSSLISSCTLLPSLSPHILATVNPFQFRQPYLPLNYQTCLSPLEDLRSRALTLENQGRHSEALSYWKIAVERGDGYACYRIGNLQWWGWGFKHDEKRARQLWLRSAEAGHIGGIGRCQWFGIGHFNEDKKSAFQLYLTLADQGDPDAINKIGAYYEGGNDVEKDEEKALYYYRLAAEKSHCVAQYNLANALMRCSESSQDVTKAVYYYHISAEAGIPKAQYALGILYEEGNVLKKDRNEALKWYNRAAQMGCSEAAKKICVLMEERAGESIQVNATESRSRLPIIL